MPPKKEVKEKAVKGDEAEEMVLQYLKSVNRPYASTDVSANLKNKVPKAAAQKIMQALAEKAEITMKAYGKQTIFVYNQEKLPVMSSEEMSRLDSELRTAQDEVRGRKEELKLLEKELAQIENVPKSKELPVEIQKLEAENAVLLKNLAPFRKTGDQGTQVQPLTAEETKKIDAEFTKWRKQWVDRRKVYKEIVGVLADGSMINDIPAWQEEAGIDPDDDDAKAVEEGEFCKPQPIIRPNTARPRPAGLASKSLLASKPTPPTSTTAAVSTSSSKRSMTEASEEEKPKKKSKKVTPAT